MDLPEEITPESAQKLLRMAEELMVTRQALEHALQSNQNQDMSGAKAALNSVVVLSDRVNEALRVWLENEQSLQNQAH
ncbi:MAG: hypothetical protein VX210_04880 [Myxococcota bacterium]|nr:hypothetical protein [Myxococcota bacterium]